MSCLVKFRLAEFSRSNNVSLVFRIGPPSAILTSQEASNIRAHSDERLPRWIARRVEFPVPTRCPDVLQARGCTGVRRLQKVSDTSASVKRDRKRASPAGTSELNPPLRGLRTFQEPRIETKYITEDRHECDSRRKENNDSNEIVWVN